MIRTILVVGLIALLAACADEPVEVTPRGGISPGGGPVGPNVGVTDDAKLQSVMNEIRVLIQALTASHTERHATAKQLEVVTAQRQDAKAKKPPDENAVRMLDKLIAKYESHIKELDKRIVDQGRKLSAKEREMDQLVAKADADQRKKAESLRAQIRNALKPQAVPAGTQPVKPMPKPTQPDPGSPPVPK